MFSLAAVLLVRGKLTDTGSAILADQARIVAAALPADPTARDAAVKSMSTALDRQGIALIQIGVDGTLPASDRLAVRAARDAGAGQAVGGASVSATSSVGGDLRLVEARSTKSGGFALVTLAYDAVPLQDSVLRRLLVALLIGTVVAIVIGLFAARSLSASVRRTAALAKSMGGGDLQVRVPVTGPREVAEISSTLNGLADALQRSETSRLQQQPSYGRSVVPGDRMAVPPGPAGFARPAGPPAPAGPTGPPPPDTVGHGSPAADGLFAISHQADRPGGPDPALGGLVPIRDEVTAAGGPDARSHRPDSLRSDFLEPDSFRPDAFHLDLGPTDLRGLVIQIGQAWRARCDSAGVPLIVEVPRESVFVISDTRRLRQVLDELADNALRLLEPGQPLILHLGREGQPEGPGTAVVQVRDGGPGLTSEDFPVMFQQSVLRERYRGRRPGGAGLGLALVHRLITQLGGSIMASPAPEGGVAMTIRLPVTAGAAP